MVEEGQDMDEITLTVYWTNVYENTTRWQLVIYCSYCIHERSLLLIGRYMDFDLIN